MNFRFFTCKAIVIISIAFFFVGCASDANLKKVDRIVQKVSYQKIYLFGYEQVWRAAQLSIKYPIAVNNMDHGSIETEYIDAADGFVTPGSLEGKGTDGETYKISLFLTKGKVQGQESVRVQIKKIMEKKKDFFTDNERIESNGIEEKVILYRIERELAIEDAIKKAQHKPSEDHIDSF